jgi:hypothetical protein
VYGDALSDAQKRKIVENVFRNFAKGAIAEFPYVGAMSAEAVRKLVTVSKEEEQYLWSTTSARTADTKCWAEAMRPSRLFSG